MKVLPENKKRAIILIAILVISTTATIYVVTRSPAPAAPGAPVGESAPTAASSKGVEFTGGLLPYGSKLDLGILKQQTFQALRPAPGISVSPADLGKTDIFAR